MNNRLVVRRATESDMKTAFKLIGELGYPDVKFPEFARTYTGAQQHPAMTLLVAECDGVVVGLASISRRPQLRLGGDLITIDELVISDRFRGSGIGKAILERVKSMCVELGARRLELETTRTRESYKRRFYVKNGFSETNSAVMRIDFARQ